MDHQETSEEVGRIVAAAFLFYVSLMAVQVITKSLALSLVVGALVLAIPVRSGGASRRVMVRRLLWVGASYSVMSWGVMFLSSPITFSNDPWRVVGAFALLAIVPMLAAVGLGLAGVATTIGLQRGLQRLKESN